MGHTQRIMAMPSDAYPHFAVTHIQNPSRLYAVPLLGILVKLIMCIPQYIMLFFVVLAWSIATFLVNPFVVLLTGKYWRVAHSLSLAYFRLVVKVSLFFTGLTNKYPGFDFNGNSDFELEIPLPQNPNRLFAAPVIGGVVRYVLLIPYLLYMGVVEMAACLGVVFGASFVVLFTGKYPESIYELTRDYFRLMLAGTSYFAGLRDEYPSFWISMSHKNVKIALIALSALYMLFYYGFYFVAMIAGIMTGQVGQQNTPPPLYQGDEALVPLQDSLQDDTLYEYEADPTQDATY